MARGHRWLLALGASALLGGALGCASAIDAPLPDGSVPFTPPPVYQLWWSMALACSGRTGSLEAVHWYVVPGATSIPGQDASVQGLWETDGNRIILAGSEQLDGPLVRHEMLHSLLGRADAGTHPRAQFLERCGGVVACDGRCLVDAGASPAPPADAIQVPPLNITVAAEVTPADPGSAHYGGWFAVTVTAHNPSSHAVVAYFPEAPAWLPGPGFGYWWAARGSEIHTWDARGAVDASQTTFAPGETKRYVFDFVNASASGPRVNMPPGSWTFTPLFGGHAGNAIPITVAP